MSLWARIRTVINWVTLVVLTIVAFPFMLTFWVVVAAVFLAARSEEKQREPQGMAWPTETEAAFRRQSAESSKSRRIAGCSQVGRGNAYLN